MRALRVPAFQQNIVDREGCPKWKLTKPGLSEQVAVITYLQEMVWRNPDPEHSRHHDFSVRHIYRNEASKWGLDMGRKRNPVLFIPFLPPLRIYLIIFEIFDATTANYFLAIMGCLSHITRARTEVWNPSFRLLSIYIKPLLFTREPRKIAPAIIFPITVVSNHEAPINDSHGIPRLDRVYICHLCGEDLRHQCSSPTKSSQSFCLL